MSFLTGGSSAPTPAPVPAAPSKSPADLAAQTRAAQQAAMQQEDSGRASTILSNPLGTSGRSFAAKTLLGA